MNNYSNNLVVDCPFCGPNSKAAYVGDIVQSPQCIKCMEEIRRMFEEFMKSGGEVQVIPITAEETQ